MTFVGAVRRKRPSQPPFPGGRRPSWLPSRPDTKEAAQDHAAALLELARANHHLALALERGRKTSKVGAVMSRKQNKYSNLNVLKNCLSQLNARGGRINVGADTDTPPELAPYSDGLSDDAAYDSEIIGCSCPPGVSGNLADVAVGAGIPSYWFSQKNLQNPVLRRRVAAAIQALSPKMRRRVIERLRTVATTARVSGNVRNAYPSVSGYEGGYPSVGWEGVTVGRSGGCPYANVAGALTP